MFSFLLNPLPYLTAPLHSLVLLVGFFSRSFSTFRSFPFIVAVVVVVVVVSPSQWMRMLGLTGFPCGSTG